MKRISGAILSFISVKPQGCQRDLRHIPGFAASSSIGTINLSLNCPEIFVLYGNLSLRWRFNSSFPSMLQGLLKTCRKSGKHQQPLPLEVQNVFSLRSVLFRVQQSVETTPLNKNFKGKTYRRTSVLELKIHDKRHLRFATKRHPRTGLSHVFHTSWRCAFESKGTECDVIARTIRDRISLDVRWKKSST